jgi:hypothetical protein
MPTVSEKCFNCGKSTVLYYDFIAVEDFQHRTQKGNWTTTSKNQRLLGFLRLTLCGECLQRCLMAHIDKSTKKNGTPALFAKKEVAFSGELLSKMQQGVYEDSIAMQYLFKHELARPYHPEGFPGLYDSHPIMKMNFDFPIEDSVSINVKLIEPEYALLALTELQNADQQPFAHEIAQTMDGSKFEIYLANHLDKLQKASVSFAYKDEIVSLKSLYQTRLVSV